MKTSPPARGSLTHEPDRFSDEAWDLLLAGQDVARRWRHEQLDVEHLLQVLFSDPAFRRWIAPLSVRPEDLLDRLEDVLAEQPAGRGDELFIGEDLEELLLSSVSIPASLHFHLNSHYKKDSMSFPWLLHIVLFGAARLYDTTDIIL